MKQDRRTSIYGFATEVLEKKTYADLESMCDGIMDVKAIEVEEAQQTIVRVRSFPDVQHAKGWQAMNVEGNSVLLAPASKIDGA
jgi:KaiC/GvpD/RAD55 family RecA-like ATPase